MWSLVPRLIEDRRRKEKKQKLEKKEKNVFPLSRTDYLPIKLDWAIPLDSGNSSSVSWSSSSLRSLKFDWTWLKVNWGMFDIKRAPVGNVDVACELLFTGVEPTEIDGKSSSVCFYYDYYIRSNVHSVNCFFTFSFYMTSRCVSSHPLLSIARSIISRIRL